MIELPESTRIASQINAELAGKTILAGTRGNSPHKFAFYNRPPEEYAAILPGKVVGEASVNGSLILARLDPGFTLILGGGGERIVYHPDDRRIPAKHQLWLGFRDGGFLTVTVQGWGAVFLLENEAVLSHQFVDSRRPNPLSPEFSPEYFLGLFADLDPGDSRSLKFFLISKPGVLGLGNGCLQDILWQARLHPRHRAAQLSKDQQLDLYSAIRETLARMVALGGRASDFDLYDQPGDYQRILDSQTVGKPCPNCGTAIEKAAFLGGAIYFCLHCQL